MYNFSRNLDNPFSRALLSCLALLLTISLSSSLLIGQTRLTGTLNEDGGTHRIEQPGIAYTDFTVPQAGAQPYLIFLLRGGDGGKSWITNIFKQVVHTGQGGQGATVKATFKIGNGANELKPGSTLRLIIGQRGNGGTNCYACSKLVGAGGGGATGIVYLPAGADAKVPSNWKILMVAGGGGGGAISSIGGNHWNGYPGQASESGRMVFDLLKEIEPDNYYQKYKAFNDIFGHFGNGGQSTTTGGGGGGTSWRNWAQANNGSLWPVFVDDQRPYVPFTTGDGYAQWTRCELCPEDFTGKGLFQMENGVLSPIGGKGGAGSFTGGFGFAGGGGSYNTQAYKGAGGGGGGYSGGGPGDDNEFDKLTKDNLSGGGGGSYLHPDFVLPASGQKIENGNTDNPINGFIEYTVSSTGPATRDLYFECHKGTEVSVLKSGDWTLLWQYDGNLVLYGPGFPNGAWASNTAGTDLFFQGDGNLVIYQANAGPWSSDTADDHHNGKGGRKLVLTQEGGLYITDQDGKVIWTGH